MTRADRISRLNYARKMEALIQDALLTGPGIVQVSADGVSTTFDRDQAYLELERFRKQIHRYERSMSRIKKINLANADD